MKTALENEKFDTMIQPSDWRYSASIVGLVKFFKFYKHISEAIEYTCENDIIKFSSEDITVDRFLKFTEEYYKDEFHHVFVENKLAFSKFSEEEIKLINEKLVGNTVMKGIFSKTKFDGSNKEEICDLINKNRSLIIMETFRNKSNMYKNYSNKYQLFKEKNDCCRINGYYEDLNRKGKSLAYNFKSSTFVANDDAIFDFIPFAFTSGRESFFINDNFSIENLLDTNQKLQRRIEDVQEAKSGKNDARVIFFTGIIESSDLIDFDVEVICKNVENSYFETLLIRKNAIKILKQIKDFKVFCFSFKVNDNYYINIQREVTNSILNNLLLDKYIEMFLKLDSYRYLGIQLININVLIKGGNLVNKSMYSAFKCAERVSGAIEENKLKSYRQKLTSAIVFKDYNRVCEILLQLSNYSNVNFDFTYDLYENFEENKEIAYTFINALKKSENRGDNSNE